MDNFLEILLLYLIDKAMILIPCLWILGKIIKSTPKIPNYLIPYILLAFGIAGSIGLLGIEVSSIIQGILVTGLAVFGYESAKALLEALNKNNNI